AAHPLNRGQRLALASPRQYNHKLIAAIAHNAVICIEFLTDGLRDLLQNFAPEQMAVRVHDAFEMVQIKKNERKFLIMRVRRAHETVEIAMQVTRVVESGNVIRHRKLKHAIVLFFQFERKSMESQ